MFLLTAEELMAAFRKAITDLPEPNRLLITSYILKEDPRYTTKAKIMTQCRPRTYDEVLADSIARIKQSMRWKGITQLDDVLALLR